MSEARNSDKVRELSLMTWQEAQQAFREVDFGILPIGSIEAHGPHLPISTDLVIAEYLAREVAKITGSILLPPIAYTPCWSLRYFPGTVTLSDDTLVQTVVEITESSYRHGLQCVFMLNAHYGSPAALKVAERLLQAKGKGRLVNLTMPGMDQAIEEVCSSRRWHKLYFHAEEAETSMMLVLSPDLVDMSKAVSEYPKEPPYFGPVSIPWSEFTRSGVVGDATVATAEKGQQILRRVIQRSVELIQAYNRDRWAQGERRRAT